MSVVLKADRSAGNPVQDCATSGTVCDTRALQKKGYERVDLSLFYNGLEDTKIALQVRNVFDERYVEGRDSFSSTGHFGSPTAVLLTVRIDLEGLGK